MAAAVLGWQVFLALKLPAAPVLGGMAFVAAANLLGLPLELPSGVRLVMSVSLGISIGSRFHMTVGRGLVKALILFVGFVIAGSLGIGAVVGRLGMEKHTAMFASLLGGLTEMTFLAQEFQFDSFQVTLFQTMRMCMLLVVMPVIARKMPAGEAAGEAKSKGLRQATKMDWLLIAVLSLALGRGLFRLCVPAGKMLGGVFVTAVYSRVRRLRPKLNAAWRDTILSLIGGTTGLNVTMASLSQIQRKLVPLAVYLCLIAGVIWMVYHMLRRVAGLDGRTALFAATMGGLSPSIAMAEAVGADSTVVSSFQVIRYFTVIALALVLGSVM